MYLQQDTDVISYIVGILVGLLFVFAVWYLYKKAYQLQRVNRSENTEQAVGRECTIYFNQGEGKYTVQVSRDGAMREVDVISETSKVYRTETKQLSLLTERERCILIKGDGRRENGKVLCSVIAQQLSTFSFQLNKSFQLKRGKIKRLK